MNYQFMKSTATTWTAYRIELMTHGEHEASVYEMVARVVLDTTVDRFYVERPVWDEKGCQWDRISKSYLTQAAAFRAIMSPSLKS